MSDDPDSRASYRRPQAAFGESSWLRAGVDPQAAVRFTQAALGLLIFSFVVIIFGAFVRASLSGDGCGVHWPDCHGAILPEGAPLKTYIELTHRGTSGLLLLGILGMFIASLRIFPKGSPYRKASGIALGACLVSAAIGAILVLNSYVTHDKSLGRAITMPLHLVNNYLLAAAMVAMCLPASVVCRLKLRGSSPIKGAFWASVAGMFLLGMTGALSAMGKTAFEQELKAAQGLADRLHLHIGDAAHPLLKGGVAHPVIAASVMVLTFVCLGLIMKRRPTPEVKYWGQLTMSWFVAQMVLGLVNLLLSAPVWLQLLHLALALMLWGSLVMTGIYAFSTAEETIGGGDRHEEEEAAKEAPGDGKAGQAGQLVLNAEPQVKPGWKDLIKAYIALTKPRVISLLLFTTVLAMVIANGAWPPVWQMLLVALGGYLMAGAANALNMVVERDLDVAMERTASRPTVTALISVRSALVFALLAASSSFAILSLSANVLAAGLALAGLAFYVLVYTLLLKRRTWQNIVIGGAAGAFPPLVGYAAVKNELSAFAWVLFAIIFFWTPVHFWALAILIKDDYAKAGVPMLPVVKGDRATVVQIVVYAIATALICIVPLFLGELGMIYLVGAVLLNIGLIVQSIKLMQDTCPPRAKALFKYSMVYLALLFVIIAVDRSTAMPWG